MDNRIRLISIQFNRCRSSSTNRTKNGSIESFAMETNSIESNWITEFDRIGSNSIEFDQEIKRKLFEQIACEENKVDRIELSSRLLSNSIESDPLRSNSTNRQNRSDWTDCKENRFDRIEWDSQTRSRSIESEHNRPLDENDFIKSIAVETNLM